MLDRRAWLNIITDALPERQRVIMTALYFEGVSEREIARRLGVHQSSVQSVRDTALLLMQKYYGALEDFLAEDS